MLSRLDGQTKGTKPICPTDFFKVGGIKKLDCAVDGVPSQNPQAVLMLLIMSRIAGQMEKSYCSHTPLPRGEVI